MTEFLKRSNQTADCNVIGFYADDEKPHRYAPPQKHTALLINDGDVPTLFVNCGPKDAFNINALKKSTQLVANEIKKITVSSINLSLPQPKDIKDSRFCQTVVLSLLQSKSEPFHMKKNKTETETSSLELVYLEPFDEQSVKQAKALSVGLEFSKRLGDLPPNICTPSYLEKQAQELSQNFEKLSVKTLNESKMKELGMNALLAVSQGSKEEAKLIELSFEGGNRSEAPYMFVGKGITFDSGGLSLKPPTGMVEMKYDMCGGAVVLGLMKAVATMNLPINVIGIVAASENLPSSEAVKPSDVVTSMSGQTVEILNTDAEGRLVLCDALTYAQKHKPKSIVDIATLTGAMIIALGHHTNGIMSNDDALCEKLLAAGNNANDKAWQLPIWEEYDEQINSNVADIANIGSDRSAGSITAACFLARFCKDVSWAHIDCAGTAWISGKNKAATGRPLPLLFEYLINECNYES